MMPPPQRSLTGELVGGDLVHELALGAAVMARGCSAYFYDLFVLPSWLAGDDAWPDIAAILTVLALTAVAILGTKLSGRFTGVLVVIRGGKPLDD